VSRQPFGEILQQALKPLRYLFLLFLQAKKAKSHLEHQPGPSVEEASGRQKYYFI